MTLPRRRFLRIVAGATAFAATSRLEAAEPYPVRPVRVVVGFPAGAGADLAARLTAEWLSERMGQPFVVENRPGAAGNVGAELVARAARDGYTLLLINSSNAINATLYDNLNFNLIRDIAPVAGVFRGPFVMVVNPAFPAKSLVEFIADAKASPGKINMASPGIGTTPHLAGELLNMMAGINVIHVPYRGTGPAITDLLAGRVQMTFASMLSATEYVRQGQLRALAVTSSTRWDALPDLPTVADVLPGYEASAWFVVGAPAGTSAAIVDTLNSQINAGLADPTMKARVADLGGMVLPGAPAEFAKLIADETDKWGRVVKAAGIKAG
ncbi:MAG: tripartite tricarboxylate transporter substrate binding protein [Xanthobacteraceae bacterium]|jgi:tripartite-type tricarboxylate transporter receptor subunit TctC